MRRPVYHSHKHYRYLDAFYRGEKVSRKTKKFLQYVIAEGYMFTMEEYRWMNMPSCKWCSGGTVRDHPDDSGYSCPDCYGTGKSGWKFTKDWTMVEIETGLDVKP